MPHRHRHVINPGPSKDWVALTCAIGFCTALNIVTFAVLWDALFSDDAGLSENAVQLLTGWGGGLIGVIGAYIGYKAAITPEGITEMTGPNDETTERVEEVTERVEERRTGDADMQPPDDSDPGPAGPDADDDTDDTDDSAGADDSEADSEVTQT